ncbi:MAG TPA: 3-hydroxyacyl-ACP dehydratase FabZ [Rhizomicrobium sp.]|jgi:3-hydroxyacyl-[acyl-carrier-protein] dehydratase|nr:3-hydroxyacyl-ACP dehydratase FabZ [Rhizomicrobium sp.]
MGESGQTGAVLDVEQLKKLLPHRPPFLLIERLSDIVPFESGVGHKAVSINEPHFIGHFPDYSVMPGVLIVEAMAQTAGAVIVHSMALKATPLVFFMGIDKARFRKPVVPGDMLRLSVRAVQHRGPVWKFEGKAHVGEALCAEAEFSAMIRTGDAG